MEERTVNEVLRLELRSFQAGPVPPRVYGFAKPLKALEHLCDHLLTYPECHTWALWLPTLSDLLERGDRARLRFARALWREDAGAAQPLYDEWMRFLESQCRAAAELGWMRIVSPRLSGRRRDPYRDVEWLGPSGAFLVASERGVLRTAYFPLDAVPREIGAAGAGTAGCVQSSDRARIEARRRRPLPREGARLVDAPRVDRPRGGVPEVEGRPYLGSDPSSEIILERFRAFRCSAAIVRQRWSGSSKGEAGGLARSTVEALRQARRNMDSWRRLPTI